MLQHTLEGAGLSLGDYSKATTEKALAEGRVPAVLTGCWDQESSNWCVAYFLLFALGLCLVAVHDPVHRPLAEQIVSQTLDVPVNLEADPAALSAQVANPERVADTLTQLSQAGIAVTDFSLGQPSLDEVFLALTGQPIEDETQTTEEISA